MTFDGKVEITSDSTIIFVPYIYPTAKVKEFGFSWNREDKFWYSPFTERAYRQLVEYFSCDTSEVILPEISEISVRSEIDESPLFSFQKEGSEFLLQNKRALLGFAPGLGKTSTSVIAASLVSKPVLVVCPLTLAYNWKREIYKWSGKEAVIWHRSPNTWGHAKDGWVITNYETVARQMVEFNEHGNSSPKFSMDSFGVLIVDESVLVKNRKAKRTKAIKSISKNIEYVWLLSGSPTTKFYDDMWSQLNILYPSQFSSYWRFVYTYCEVFDDVWGKKIVGNKPRADEDLKSDLKNIYLAKTQEQVSSDPESEINIPEWIVEDLFVPMGKTQYKSYKQMEDLFFASLPESDDVIIAPNTLAQLTRLIQLASNTALLGGANHGSKWDAVKELVEYTELPMIVWTTYKRTAELMTEFFGKKLRVSTLTGDTPREQRQGVVDKFQQGDTDILVAHPAVGKYGLTLTLGRTSVYLERGFNFDDYFQSLYRISRIGTTKSPMIYHLIATSPEGKPTVDSVINKVLKYRQNSAMKLTTGVLRKNWKEL